MAKKKLKGDHMMTSFSTEPRKPEMFVTEECPNETKKKCETGKEIAPCIYGYVDMELKNKR